MDSAEAIKPIVAETTVLQAKPGRSSGAGWFHFKPGLRFKLISLTIAIALISLLLSAFLLLSLQRRQLIESAQTSAWALGDAIEASLMHAMLSGNIQMVGEILRAVTEDGTIQQVRILDERGVVSFSSTSDEVGARLNREMATCQGCHAGDALTGNHVLVPALRNDPPISVTAKVIENQPACHGCHAAEDQQLGLLLLELPLPHLEGQLRDGFWRVAVSGLATFVLLLGLLVPMLNRYVIRPLETLSKGVMEATAGNLDYPVQMAYQDELGSLAASFTTMQSRLRTSYAEMERKEAQLATLNETALAVTQLLELHEIMAFALDTVVDRLGMQGGLIFLWDEEDGRYQMQASRGLSAGQIVEIDRRRRCGWDIAAEVARTSQEVCITDLSGDVRFQGLWDRLWDRSFIELPMLSRGLVVGVIGMFTHAGQQVEPSDLEYLKSVGREIGIAIDNALLLEATRRGEREALALYKLGTRISASLALPDVLAVVVEAARELLDGDIGLVGLFNESISQVVIQAVAGPGAEMFQGMRIPLWEGMPGNALVKGLPVLFDGHERSRQPALHNENQIPDGEIGALLAAPLIHGENHFLGLVEVIRRQPRRYLERDTQLLQRLAHQVVVSVENAQLYRQLRHVAVLDERGRLAREMHDHLAQALGYLNVRASITDDLLRSGRIDQAQESLTELKSVTKVVYTDLREAIFSLRTSVSSHRGLIPTLRNYLDEYQAHYGVDVQLSIRSEAEFDLPVEVAGQLVCIVQEALANIRKHSGVSHAFVRYEQAGDQICLEIQDEGNGFDLSRAVEIGGQHIGLQVMRERAESVGGRLEIDSGPGHGTLVTVRVPIQYGG